MGDRANIVMIDKNKADSGSFPHPIFLYTHWRGSEIKTLLSEALNKGRSRWEDGQYLGRIIFQALLGGDNGETGFGLSSRIGDGGYNLLLVHPDTGTVEEVESDSDEGANVLKSWTFAQFVADH